MIDSLIKMDDSLTVGRLYYRYRHSLNHNIYVLADPSKMVYCKKDELFMKMAIRDTVFGPYVFPEDRCYIKVSSITCIYKEEDSWYLHYNDNRSLIFPPDYSASEQDEIMRITISMIK